MEFTKSETPCDMSFGLYRIDHDYIDALRKNEKLIIDPNVNDLYCGPVYHGTCDRGVFGFFVPIDEKYFDNTDMLLMAFCNGNFAGFADYNKMIPVVNPAYLDNYAHNHQLVTFCLKGQKVFETCGDAMVAALKNKVALPFMSFG